ncbi:hypothetical protein EVAR_56912_1 [Eumeta japonica]|uniref:Uncharacterized protein n=1 Tax=Eumeta variegata TaxID=151549 RepID=A0A4C1YBH6_EUMVA|nr:hypothetical protein EVAR_56912_1 [Eumeta japonica]
MQTSYHVEIYNFYLPLWEIGRECKSVAVTGVSSYEARAHKARRARPPAAPHEELLIAISLVRFANPTISNTKAFSHLIDEKAQNKQRRAASKRIGGTSQFDHNSLDRVEPRGA